MLLPEEIVILLAEDRADDVRLIQHALTKAGIRNPLFVVPDGQEAIDYLGGSGRFANRKEFPRPDLMLLDLKMPKVEGFQVLEWVRDQPELKALRIIVLTSSEDIYDINKAYGLGANSFLVKPLEFENLASMTRTLGAFWLHYNKAPELERRRERRKV